ncbi:hypothetical protein Q3G72_014305 [Acer saccharum]|nr:hypothetical protein Q3G72_014305 [Acer saccharum]
MVRDLTIEFRAFRDSFSSDGTYTRRTPYHPRKRTRTEAVEFQNMSPYSPTALIPYPTPLQVTKPSPSKESSDPDATDSKTASD